MSSTTEWQERWRRSMLDNYGMPPIALVRGSGMEVTDADGRTYLDFLAGIAVSTLGHAHPALVRAVAEQMATLVHTSNLAIHPMGVALAERLIALSGWPARVFFAQDGATANEAALKIARRRGYDLAPNGARQRIVAMEGSFHGRTMGALAVTGNPAKRDPFAPFGHEVTFVPYGDVTALAAAMGPDVAAVITEPVQGENGVVPAPEGFLAAARTLASEHDSLLIVDEVQSGIGRTGHWFASAAAGIVPDIMTLAKGLAGGLPLGAVLVTGAAASALRPGDHGTTFGGNPVSCAAALAVLDTVEGEQLLTHVQTMGERLSVELRRLPRVREVRGPGLWLGVVLDDVEAAAVEAALRDRGFLVNAVRPDVVRLAPPLIVQPDHIDALLAAFAAVLEEVA